MSDHMSWRQGADRALFERERVIGNERRLVDFAHDARAPAGGAGARAVEGEVLGARTIERLVADGTLERLFGSHVEAGRHVMAVRTFMATQTREHEAQVVEQLGGGAEGGMHPGRGRALAQRDGSRHVQDLIYLRTRGLADAGGACRWKAPRGNDGFPPRTARLGQANSFPDPDTPAMPTIWCSGMSTSISFRLWTRAPRTSMAAGSRKTMSPMLQEASLCLSGISALHRE